MVKNLGDCAVRATPATHRRSGAFKPTLGRHCGAFDPAILFRNSFAPKGFAAGQAGWRIMLSEPSVRPLSVRLLVLPVADEIVDHGRVGERRGVAEIAVLVFGDLAQNPAHDLSRARLRQTGSELNEIRRGNGADLLAHPGDQLLAQVFARAFA